MSIIRASKNFEGGEMSQKANTYIKPGIKLVDFKNKDNGVYLFLLGAYKQDTNGNGVWYKPIKIRDNFGVGMYKEKFAVRPNCPIDYFSNKVMTFAPDMAKSSKVTDPETGKDRWIYPAWGRTAWRVLYNAAIYGEFGAGVHVLDLPMNGGGNVIDEHVRGKQANGEDNPSLTDYENAIPINIKLDLKAKGQPWKIQINATKPTALPVELADTDYLYNLDEVIKYPEVDELMEKLKSVVPTDVFRKGLDGYETGTTTVSMSTTVKDEIPMVFENPVTKPNIPKTAIPKATIAPTINIPKPPENVQHTGEGLPEASVFTPGSSSGNAALAAAQSFLRNNKK
jgi:hypothetical protein